MTYYTLETAIKKLRKAIKELEDYQHELVDIYGDNPDRHTIIMIDAQLVSMRTQLAMAIEQLAQR